MSPDRDPARAAAGREMMRQVYGWDIGEVHGDFMQLTLEHLFGEVWTRPGFTVRERRLLLVGMLVGGGLDDVVALQLDRALALGELSADELRELVIFVAHYAGWPTGAKVNTIVEDLLAKAAKAAATAADSATAGTAAADAAADDGAPT